MDPYTKQSIRYIKKVERSVINNNNNRENNVTERINGIKSEYLELRKEISRLVMFYKTLHGHTTLRLPNYLVGKKNTWPY